jgi:hypothetical protein
MGGETRVKGKVPALRLGPATRRALQLDARAAILPMDRRDRLAEHLTDDVETLEHLARRYWRERPAGFASDLAHLETWADATGQPLSWPATEALALKFVAHHLWDPSKRASDLRHGMPAESRRKPAGGGVAALEWPPCPMPHNTVKRRLAGWSTLHRWKGIEGPFAAPGLRSALRLAV